MSQVLDKIIQSKARGVLIYLHWPLPELRLRAVLQEQEKLSGEAKARDAAVRCETRVMTNETA